jgi:large subunit ribosomal protein L30
MEKTKNKRTIMEEENKISLSPKKADSKEELMLIIRISGLVGVNKFVEETLYRLNLRRKYSATVIKPTKDILGMIEKARHYIAFGKIDKETLIKLLKARAQRTDKKQFKAEETAELLISGKSLKESGFKPFFRLHPPRGGMKKSPKQQFPIGILGPNKEINKLVEKML